MVVKKTPIRIIGDSMVRRIGQQVGCRMEGSGVDCKPGARIQEVKQKVEERVSSLQDGLLVIQGGGNGLVNVGQEETVKTVVEAVKAAEGKKMKVAVVGVIRRPREDRRYEWVRLATNARIQEEMLKLKMEWMKEKKGDVSFIDLDRVLDQDRLR